MQWQIWPEAAHKSRSALQVSADDNEDDFDRRTALTLLDLAVSLRSCMDVENALNCSCPIDMLRHADKAVAKAEDVLAGLPNNPADDNPIRCFIRQAAQAQASYLAHCLE